MNPILDPLHSAMKEEILALREQVEELEKLLEHAVYAAPAEIAKMQGTWALSHNQAAIMIAMWRARGRPLTTLQIDAAAPRHVPSLRSDPEYRGLKCVSVWIYHLRLMFGAASIPSRQGTGYWLSPEMLSRIDAVLV